MTATRTAFAALLAFAAAPTLALAAADQDFAASADRVFEAWDTDDDGRIESDEFAEGLTTAWSSGGDLDEVDFHVGWQTWFAAPQPAFADYDDDDSGSLSREELHEAVAAADLTAHWQGAEDGYLTPEEFRTGLEMVADLNEDGTLQNAEAALITGIAMGLDAPDTTGAVASPANITGIPEVEPPAPDAAPDVNVTPVCDGVNQAAAADCPPETN